MAGQRTQYLLTLLCAGLYYILSGSWLSRILFYLVIGVPWLSLILTLPAIATFRATVDADKEILETEEETAIWIQGDSKLPPPPFRWVLQVHSCFTGKPVPCEDDFSSDHCGGFIITPEKVWVYDYLCLFRFRVKNPEPVRILVRPTPIAMEALTDTLPAEENHWIPKPGGGFSENHELRPYRPGDSLNRMHWKLSAKAGSLILREPMEPVRTSVLLTINLHGNSAELDRKFGRLLWLGQWLLQHRSVFTILALTGNGWLSYEIGTADSLQRTIDDLLCQPINADPEPEDIPFSAAWQYTIGGDADGS